MATTGWKPWEEAQEEYLRIVREARAGYEKKRNERAGLLYFTELNEFRTGLMRVREEMAAWEARSFADRGCAFHELTDFALSVLELQVDANEQLERIRVLRDAPLAQELLNVMFVDGITEQVLVSGAVFRNAVTRLYQCMFSHALEMASQKGGDRVQPDRIVCLAPLRAGVAGSIALHREGVSHFAYIGSSRDEQTLKTKPPYHKRWPDAVPSNPYAFITDPMLAGGETMCEAVAFANEHGIPDDHIVALVAVSAPEGIDKVLVRHPDVRILAASVQGGLNSNGYIKQARLGDAGQMFCDDLNPQDAWELLVKPGILTNEELGLLHSRTAAERRELRAARPTTTSV